MLEREAASVHSLSPLSLAWAPETIKTLGNLLVASEARIKDKNVTTRIQREIEVRQGEAAPPSQTGKVRSTSGHIGFDSTYPVKWCQMITDAVIAILPQKRINSQNENVLKGNQNTNRRSC